MTLSEAFGLYRTDYIYLKNLSGCTEDNYRQALRALQKVHGDMLIELLTLEHIKQWQAYMTKRGFSAGTQRGYLSKLKNVLKFTNRRHLTDFDLELFELPKAPIQLPKYITPDEVKLLLVAALCQRDELIISLLFSVGIRVTELCRLNRRDVVGNRIQVWGKGNRYRTVTVDPRTLERLTRYLQGRKDNLQPLILTSWGTRIGKSRVEEIVREAGKRAGIERRVTPHILRHSHATDLLSNGADIRYIQHSLGHAHISTTQLYTHIIDKDYERVYAECHTVV